ncbi:MAG: hypothetical protein KC584_02525, partial [Nitrospira sp.]|nr:hypothetical protein [Nitrospira sp.]
VLEQQKDALHQVWKLARSPLPTPAITDHLQDKLVLLLSRMSQEILGKFYPEAKGWLEKSPG